MSLERNIKNDNDLIEYAKTTNQGLTVSKETMMDVANSNIASNNLNYYFNSKIGKALSTRIYYGIEQGKNGYLPLSQFVTNTINDELIAPLSNDDTFDKNHYYFKELINIFSDVYLNQNLPSFKDTSKYISQAKTAFKNWYETDYVKTNTKENNTTLENIRKQALGGFKNVVTGTQNINEAYVRDLFRTKRFYDLRNIPWSDIDFAKVNDNNIKKIASIGFAVSKSNQQTYLKDTYLPKAFIDSVIVALERIRWFLKNLFSNNALLLNDYEFDFSVTPFALANKFNVFALSNNELIDLATSKDNPSAYNTLTLLAKYVYLKETNQNNIFGSLEKITIINPVLNTIWTMDTKRIPADVYNFVKYEVLGFGFNENSLIRNDSFLELVDIYKEKRQNALAKKEMAETGQPAKITNTPSYLPKDYADAWIELIKYRVTNKYNTNNPYGELNNAFAQGVYMGSKFIDDKKMIQDETNYYETKAYNPTNRAEFYEKVAGKDDLTENEEEDFFISSPKM